VDDDLGKPFELREAERLAQRHDRAATCHDDDG
jgi:hypothetical protein